MFLHFNEPEPTGPRPRLTYEDRVEIEIGVRTNESLNAIGRRLKRPASTIKYEIDANSTKNCADGRKSGYRRKEAFGARQSGKTAQVQYRATLARPVPKRVHAAPRSAGWQNASGCVSRCRLGWRTFTVRPRSRRVCAASSPTIRRCGCRPKPSTSPSTCKDAGICGEICTRVCVLDVHCASRGPAPASVAAASPTWSTSASAHPRQPTGQCPGTGKAT